MLSARTREAHILAKERACQSFTDISIDMGKPGAPNTLGWAETQFVYVSLQVHIYQGCGTASSRVLCAVLAASCLLSISCSLSASTTRGPPFLAAVLYQSAASTSPLSQDLFEVYLSLEVNKASLGV